MEILPKKHMFDKCHASTQKQTTKIQITHILFIRFTSNIASKPDEDRHEKNGTDEDDDDDDDDDECDECHEYDEYDDHDDGIIGTFQNTTRGYILCKFVPLHKSRKKL